MNTAFDPITLHTIVPAFGKVISISFAFLMGYFFELSYGIGKKKERAPSRALSTLLGSLY